MITKHGQDNQSQTPGIRADQKERQLSNDGRRCDRAGQSGREVRSKSISFGRTDRERTDTFIRPGDDTLGGTVQQLIAETREEIHEIEARGDKLRQRLTNLEELMNTLKDHPVSE